MNEANKILMTNINHGHRFALPMRLAVKYAMGIFLSF